MFGDGESHRFGLSGSLIDKINHFGNRQFPFGDIAEVVYAAPRTRSQPRSKQGRVEDIKIEVDGQVLNTFARYPLVDRLRILTQF